MKNFKKGSIVRVLNVPSNALKMTVIKEGLEGEVIDPKTPIDKVRVRFNEPIYMRVNKTYGYEWDFDNEDLEEADE